MADLNLIKQNHEKSEKLRLNIYLDKIRLNLSSAIGELLEFWKREETRTKRKLEKFI